MKKILLWIALIIVLIVIVAVLYAVHTGNIRQQQLQNSNYVHKDLQLKTYTNSDLHLTFTYPAYMGDVVIQKRDRLSCPEMKTYAMTGQLESEDYWISFTEKPLTGTKDSFMEYYIPIAQTENVTEYCGLDLVKLETSLDQDKNYESKKYIGTHAMTAFVSDIGSTIGTQATQFYTLFFKDQNMLRVVQPTINFLPTAYSPEQKEIEELQSKQTEYYPAAILPFIKNSPNAANIRQYFKDFEGVVKSIQFTN